MVTDTYTKMFQALLPKNIKDFAKKGGGTVQDGIKVFVLAWIITLVLGIIGFFVAVGTAGAEMQALSSMIGLELVGFLGVVVLIIGSVIALIWGVVGQYIMQYVGAWCAISFFNGKGKFAHQFYVVMLFTGAIMIISSVFGLLDAIVPAIVIVTSIISLVLWLWSLYLLYLTIKNVHGLELGGSVISTFVVLIVGVVLTLIVGIALAAVLVGVVGAGALGGVAATGGLGNLGI